MLRAAPADTRSHSSISICRQKRKSPPREEVRQAFQLYQQQLGGGVPLLYQAPLGRRSVLPENEALREQVQRFVGLSYTALTDRR